MLAALSLFCFPASLSGKQNSSPCPTHPGLLSAPDPYLPVRALTATRKEVGASHNVREVWIWHVVCWVCQQASLEDPWVMFIL